MLRANFGTSNREEKTYEEVVQHYESLLDGGAVSPKTYLPNKQRLSKQRLITQMEVSHAKLVRQIQRKWDEKELSRFILPHPLMEKLTVRELLFFHVYHLDKHLSILERDYS